MDQASQLTPVDSMLHDDDTGSDFHLSPS
jgi:hypothetical protein